jgi:hypothetical protein
LPHRPGSPPGRLGALAGGWQLRWRLLFAGGAQDGGRPAALRQERREPMGKLLPLPLAKVNRTAANPETDKH